MKLIRSSDFIHRFKFIVRPILNVVINLMEIIDVLALCILGSHFVIWGTSLRK